MPPLPPDRWPEVEACFAALVPLSPEVQATRLAALDRSLAAEVRALLAADAGAEEFFARGSGVHTLLAGIDTAPVADRLAPGTRVGPWAVEEEIGRGGMGDVYRARRADGLHTGVVALKLVRRGMDSAAVLRRFAQERAVLGGLAHDGIARLIDGGTAADGRPYLALEMVEGAPITHLADQQRLGVEARLRLFLDACEAVAHAHRRLVVHRDLKPSNVLVAQAENGALRVKLLDFGIARVLSSEGGDAHTFTGEGPRPMTPEYAAPEQLDGSPVTTATDVYALGVLLFELLAGHRPYQAEGRSPLALARALREERPSRPSTVVAEAHLRRSAGAETRLVTPEEVASARSTTRARLQKRLRGDLDAIVARALRADPDARYPSVEALADDLRRHLDGLPVQARRGSARYRVTTFVRRHRAGVAVGMALGLLLAGFTAALAVQNRRVAAERDRAQAEASAADAVAGFLRDLLAAADPNEGQGQNASVREVLDEGARRLQVDLAGQPLMQARMRSVVGSVFTSMGRYAEAKALLSDALRVQQARLSPQHPDLLATQEARADLARETADFARAEQLYRAVLARRERAASNDLATARTRARLGALLMEEGQFAAAEPQLRRALEVFEQAGPTARGQTADLRGHLGRLYAERGLLRPADSLLTRSLADVRRWYGPAHPRFAQALLHIADLRYRQERPMEAEASAREALRIHRQVFGDRHAFTAQSLSMLATTLSAQGRGEAAIPVIQASLAIEKALGPGRHQLGIRYSELAFALFSARADTLGALARLDSAVQAMRASPEWRTPLAATLLWNYATVLTYVRRFDQAAGLLGQAAVIYAAALGPEHNDTRATRRAQGRALADAGRCPAAIPLLQATLPPLPQEPESFQHAVDRSALGGCLLAAHLPAKALPLLDRAYRTLHADTTLAPDHWRRRQAQDRLATAYAAQGRHAEAARVRAGR